MPTMEDTNPVENSSPGRVSNIFEHNSDVKTPQNRPTGFMYLRYTISLSQSKKMDFRNYYTALKGGS